MIHITKKSETIIDEPNTEKSTYGELIRKPKKQD